MEEDGPKWGTKWTVKEILSGGGKNLLFIIIINNYYDYYQIIIIILRPQGPRQMDEEGRWTVKVEKKTPLLGLVFEGGSDVPQLQYPRICHVLKEGAAHLAGGVRVGDILTHFDGVPLDGELLASDFWILFSAILFIFSNFVEI